MMTKKQKDKLRLFIEFIVLIFLLWFAFTQPTQIPVEPDERTKELCRDYASHDHKYEMPEERYNWLTKEYMDNFNWYQSCIDNVMHPVAK